MVADGVKVDAAFRTTVPGLFAAGDTTGQMPSVANVIAAGSSAAAHIVHELTAEAAVASAEAASARSPV
jgi:thioredoxin reductase